MSLAAQLSLDAALERDEDWSARAHAWIVALATGARFNSDALRRAVGDPHGPGNAVGGVIHRAEKAGLIRYADLEVRSVRPAARNRWIRVWERTR